MQSKEKAPLAGGAPSEDDLTAISRGIAADYLSRKIAVFEQRCDDLAGQANVGWLPFLWAVDACYDAAVASGLVGQIGDEQVQEIMGRAFMRGRVL